MGTSQNPTHQFVSEDHIFHFGKIATYQDSQGTLFFTQDYTFMVEQNAEAEFIQHLRSRNNKCPFLVQIKHIGVHRDIYCSNSARISVMFEYFPLTLQHFLDRNQQFTEPEVLRIFYCLIVAVKSLNEKQSYHGDICPQFIYIDTKSSRAKIFDSSYFKPSLNGYYRAQKEKCYCAPEILENLGENKVYPLYNHHTADTFSIGLVILQCMSLVDPLGAYSSNYDINFYYIESMLRLAYLKGYSDKLIGLVKECLQARNRPQVNKVVLKFETLGLRQKMQGGIGNQNPNKYSLKKGKSVNNTEYMSLV